MTNVSTVKLTINFNDPRADAEERDKEVQKLLAQLKGLDEIESVSRVPDLNPQLGSKSLGGFLIGLLTAEVSTENFKKLIGFLGDRLGGKTIEFEVEGNGRKLKLKASSHEELEVALKAAKDFIGV